jgi:S-adenosylmethionine/arginine decarboxylase-like enzyme
VLLAIGLTAPLVMAQDQNSRRYYDKTHKDYHRWNDNEQKSYTVFLNENHIAVHTFSKARPAEQQQYWNWRHEHPDEKR